MKSAVWMRRRFAGAALIFAMSPAALGQSQPAAAVPIPQPPQVLFKNLFTAVESAQLFPDSKTFADAAPKSSPQEILRRYAAAKPVSRAALQAFVAENFVLPAQVGGTGLPALERVSIT